MHGATLRWPLGVEASELRLDIPCQPDNAVAGPASTTMFSTSRAVIRIDRGALFSGTIRPDHVQVDGLRVPADPATVRAMRAWLMEIRRGSGSASGATWPSIEAPDLTLVLPVRDATWQELKLSASGRTDSADPSRYLFTLKTTDGAGDGASFVWDKAEGKPRSIEASAPWMSWSVLLALLDAWAPDDDLRAVVERFSEESGLSGRVRMTELAIEWSKNADIRPCARIDVELDMLSIPLSAADHERTPQERYLVFRDIRGRAALKPEGVTLDAEATFNTAPVHVHAEWTPSGPGWTGWLEGTGIAAVSIEGLTLPCDDAESAPREYAFIHEHPAVERFYRFYSPEGCVNAELLLIRPAGPDGVPDVPWLRVTVLEGQAKYHRFPYVGTEVSGIVECNPLGIFLRNLTGRHGDGVITVNAWTQDMSAPAATRVLVEGRNIALDDDLRSALPTGYRRVWDQFHPSGHANVTAFIERPGEQHERINDWTMRIDVDLLNAGVVYDVFPYALTDIQGRMTITDDAFFIDHVLASHGHARLAIEGRIEEQHRELTGLDLHIEARDVEIDDDLYAALPARMREALASMSPSGRADVSAAVFLDPADGHIRYDIDAFPRELTVRPQAVPLRIERVTGRVRFADDVIDLDGVEGVHDDALIRVQGTYPITDGGATAEMTVTCEGLSLTPEVYQALPAEARASLDRWRVRGPVRIESILRGGGETPRPATHTVVLNDVEIQYGESADPLTHVMGRIVLEGGRALSLDLRGRFGSGGVMIRAQRRTDESGDEILTGAVEVDDICLGDPIVNLLSPEIGKMLGDLNVSGRIGIRVPHFEYRVTEGKPPMLRLNGQARLEQTAIPPALELSGITGEVRISAEINVIPGWRTISGDLRFEGCSIAGRRLGLTTARWSLQSAPDQGWSKLSFSDIESSAYQGALMGECALVTNKGRTTYEMSVSAVHLSLSDVFADVPASGALPETKTVGGWLDGQITLSGDTNLSMARRGSGRFMVRDARLYRLPVLLSILQLLSLNPPDDSLQEATASFSVNGSTIRLDPVVIRGSSLALGGTGALRWSDQTLDLSLVVQNSRNWARMPVLSELMEGASREIVEVRVTGPIQRPQVKAGPLRSLRQMVDKLMPDVADGERK